MKKLGYLAYTVAVATLALATFAVPAQADEYVVRRSVVRTSASAGPGVTEYSYSEPSYVVERRLLSEAPCTHTKVISTRTLMPASSFVRVEEPQIIRKSIVVERPSVITSPIFAERPSVVTSSVVMERPSIVTSSVVLDPPVVMERRLASPVVVHKERIIERDKRHLLDARIPFVKLKLF